MVFRKNPVRRLLIFFINSGCHKGNALFLCFPDSCTGDSGNICSRRFILYKINGIFNMYGMPHETGEFGPPPPGGMSQFFLNFFMATATSNPV